MSFGGDDPGYLEFALAGLGDGREVGPALGGLLAAARGLLSADCAYILRREGNVLSLIASDSLPHAPDESVSLGVGGPEARAAIIAEAVVDRAGGSPYLNRGDLALVAAPIVLRGSVVGVFAAARQALFVPSEVRWVRILARIAGIAIENARLLEAERRRARYGETVGAIGTIERVQVQPFCQRMAAVINDVMAADITDVLLCRNLLQVEAGHGAARAPESWELIRAGEHRIEDFGEPVGLDRIDTRAGGAFAASFKTGVPYRCADAQENPKAPSGLRTIGVRSILAIPIPGDQEAQGLLIVGSRRPAAFDSDDAAFLRLVAERVGLLLRHSAIERDHARAAARQEFLSVVSHELKTPVAVIKAYSEVLDRRAGLSDWPGQDRTIVERIGEQADRMLAMIEQLLDLQRIEIGLLDLQVSPFDLTELVRGAAEAVQATTDAHTIAVEGVATCPVVADRRRIDEVITNLLDNAVKYSPAGGPIVVRVARSEGWAHLSVHDEGVGMSADDATKVFDRFFQVGAGTYRRGHLGLGLGLYIAREIVVHHGGRIAVRSEPGRGSVFTVDLPVGAVDLLSEPGTVVVEGTEAAG